MVACSHARTHARMLLERSACLLRILGCRRSFPVMVSQSTSKRCCDRFRPEGRGGFGMMPSQDPLDVCRAWLVRCSFFRWWVISLLLGGAIAPGRVRSDSCEGRDEIAIAHVCCVTHRSVLSVWDMEAPVGLAPGWGRRTSHFLGYFQAVVEVSPAKQAGGRITLEVVAETAPAAMVHRRGTI